MTHYETLGVPANAGDAEIQAAFERQKQICNSETHPDPAGATARARRIIAAYRVLHEPQRRREYDRLLERLQAPPETEAISDEELRSWLAPGSTIAGGLAAKIGAEQARRQRTSQEPPARWRRLERATGLAAIVGAVLLLAIWGKSEWTSYAKARTATVQQVRVIDGQAHLWINDGTVWRGQPLSTPAVFASGDKVRYVSIYSQQVAPFNGETCALLDVTRGQLAPDLDSLYVREAGPPDHDSCPPK